jgi:hypothetical protein
VKLRAEDETVGSCTSTPPYAFMGYFLSLPLWFPMVSLDFFSLTQSFRSHYGPGFDSASNRNEYQEYFLGVKAAGA